MGFCNPLRDALNRASERCNSLFPSLSDPARRSSLGLKAALVILHLIFVGILFLFDRFLIEETRNKPWPTVLYFFLFIATLAQYFYTAGSSPGYVLDAARAINESHTLFSEKPIISKRSASSNESLIISVEGNQNGRTIPGNNTTLWTKLVMDMYPHGSSIRNWTCTNCNIVQPPRSKHCHDCDKCVLQFDHHCVWLGTCIGQSNHFRFWWYILEETALGIWTGILYVTYLCANSSKSWWKDAIIISLLAVLIMGLIFLLLLLLFHGYLVLTNQTTYELVRRRRIPYLREIPERVHPFSKGVCRNLYNFCCVGNSIYTMDPLPTPLEIEEKSRPYTCSDVLSCRCCC